MRPQRGVNPLRRIFLHAGDQVAVNVDDNDYAIARFASRTIADVAAKMRFVAREFYNIELGPGIPASDDTFDNACIRGLTLDLNRLAAV